MRERRARHLLMWSDIRIRRLPAIIDSGGSPNGAERSVQSKPGIDFPGELHWCRDNRCQRSAHIGLATRLAAGKRGAIAAQEGKWRLYLMAYRHPEHNPFGPGLAGNP